MDKEIGNKKVGIATFHFADNYGAVLQCFALHKTINDIKGYEADVVGYIPPGYIYPKHWTNTYQKMQYENKRKMFEDFLQVNCGIDLKDSETQITGEEYDIICVGSDQVWNTASNFEEYFLPNVKPGTKKISYAASIGCSPQDKSFNKKRIKQHLSEFDAVSVRESVHVDVISELCEKKCTCVLDPTLLLDAEVYDELIPLHKKMEKPFLFFYWLKHDGEMLRGIEFANSIARKYDLCIVHSVIDVYSELIYQDAGCMFYEGIEDFLWYIKHAAFVVTNSYHGSIFSIHFETPFYTYVVEKMRCRIDTLDEHMGIHSRIVDNYISPENITKEFDFKNAKEKLKNIREQSMNYLLNALGV